MGVNSGVTDVWGLGGVLSCSEKLRLARALYRTCNVGSGVRGRTGRDPPPRCAALELGANCSSSNSRWGERWVVCFMLGRSWLAGSRHSRSRQFLVKSCCEG